MARMTRIRRSGFSIRAIREIRGEKGLPGMGDLGFGVVLIRGLGHSGRGYATG
jgi:hypothetical protein